MVARPNLVTMQHHKVIFGQHPLKLDTLAGILSRHSLKIANKAVFAVFDPRIMLNVRCANVPLNSFGGLTLIKHQIVKGGDVLLIAFK